MMEDNLNSSDVTEKMDERSDNKPEWSSSLASDLKSTLSSITGRPGSATEVSSFSEQISTEDNELSAADVSVHIFPSTTTVFAGFNVQSKAQSEAQSAASACRPSCVEKDQPKPLCALLPASMEACTELKGTQSFTSISKSQETVHAEPKADDLCAAVLLACLFCHPLDCLLATTRGCNTCLWSLCSSLCGCKPAALQPALDAVRLLDPCKCLGVDCVTWDCSLCDLCLQATECLDLAMEISQMLYH